MDFADLVAVNQNYDQTLTCSGGGSMMSAGGGESFSTLTGMDELSSEQWSAELAVIDSLRGKISANDPQDLEQFEAFVSQYWGEAGSQAVSAQVEVAATMAAVPEPEVIGVMGVMGAAVGLRRRRKKVAVSGPSV